MEELVFALIIAVIQGITEWFPISSSGHIVLAEQILGFEGGLLFEVALHFGTLMAVFVYFGKDITDIIRDFFRLRFDTESGKLGLLLIIATLPAVIVGFFLKNYFNVISNLSVLSLGFAVTGIFLMIASVNVKKKEKENGFGKSLLIGLSQAVAIIPGISRSGATISSGLLLGLSEKNAMKFAFLMSIPVIFGANVLVVGNNTLPPNLIWATLVSFLVGLITIHLTFKYILVNRKNLRWFGAYALLLALIMVIWNFMS